MNNSEKSAALHHAARACGFDGHIKTIEYKNQCFTRAEQIAESRVSRPFPVKNSYLYCDTLDTCFYFDSENNPCCAFAGCVRYNSGDFKSMEGTAAKIKAMLFAMSAAAAYWVEKGGKRSCSAT